MIVINLVIIVGVMSLNGKFILLWNKFMVLSIVWVIAYGRSCYLTQYLIEMSPHIVVYVAPSIFPARPLC